jgi:hypothetical protein
MRPPERDWPINILEGAVRSGKTWCLHPKALYCCDYRVAGRKVITGVSKQTIYNNVLADIFNILGRVTIVTIATPANSDCATANGWLSAQKTKVPNDIFAA